MSHESKINMIIKDKEALKKACDRLGLQFNEGKLQYKAYYTGDCDHSISLKDGESYEIGVREEEDGSFSLHWDAWGGGGKMIEAVGGQDSSKLKQYYGLEAAKNALLKKGINAYEEVKENGDIDLTIDVQE